MLSFEISIFNRPKNHGSLLGIKAPTAVAKKAKRHASHANVLNECELMQQYPVWTIYHMHSLLLVKIPMLSEFMEFRLR